MNHRGDAAGVSLIEILIVVGLISVLAAVAAPSIVASLRIYNLNTGAQTVAATIRGARYTAVSKNRTVRVMFNCPATDQFRVVEVVGVVGNAVDTDADRCNEDAYPYPDPDSSVAPNVDGPVMTLPDGATFGTVDDLEIDTQGRITPLTGCPTCTTGTPPASVALTNSYDTATLAISANGQVTGP